MVKKYLAIIITVFLFGFTISSTKLNFIEETNSYSENSGVVREEVTGVTYKDGGRKGVQNINILKQGNDVEVVNWAKKDYGIFTRAGTLDIAKNFELHNPEFEVIAGVNGDFFNIKTSAADTENINVLYGNRTLNIKNDPNAYAVEFNLDGTFVNYHKSMDYTEELILELYDKENVFKYRTKVKGLNVGEVKEGETAYLENSKHVYDERVTYFEVTKPTETMQTNMVFKEFDIRNKVPSIVNRRILATRDDKLIELINYNDRATIQSTIDKSSYNSMVIGTSGMIVEDGKVKSFKDMSSRSDAFMRDRHPRTGFGFDENNKMILFTVDGRKKDLRDGVDLRELGTIMTNYGVVKGYNLDGGGSTHAIFKTNNKLEYVNKSFESVARANANALLFVKRKAENIKLDYIKVINGLNLEIDLIGSNYYKEIEVFINGSNNIYNDFSEVINIDLRENRYTSISIVGYPLDDTQNKVLLYNDYLETSDPKYSLELSNNLKSERSGPFFYGEEVILTVEMAKYQLFKALLVNGHDVTDLVVDNKYQLKITEDTYVSVVYEQLEIPNYHLEIPGYIKSSHEGLVEEGTLVRLEFIPLENIKFISLLVNQQEVILTDNIYEFIMEKDTVVSLIYEEIIIPEFNLKVPDYINSNYQGSIKEGTPIVLEINLPNNLYFISLIINNQEITNIINNTYEFILKEDTIVVLNYIEVKDEYDVDNYNDLFLYLSIDFIETINLTKDILLDRKILIERPIIINGFGFSLSLNNQEINKSNYLIEINYAQDVFLNDIVLDGNNKQVLVVKSHLTVNNITLNNYNEYGIELIGDSKTKSTLVLTNPIKSNVKNKGQIIIKNKDVNNSYVASESIYIKEIGNDLVYSSRSMNKQVITNNLVLDSLLVILGFSSITVITLTLTKTINKRMNQNID